MTISRSETIPTEAKNAVRENGSPRFEEIEIQGGLTRQDIGLDRHSN